MNMHRNVKTFKKLSEAIEYIGFGIFHFRIWALSFFSVILWAAGKYHVTVLGPELRCTWSLSSFQLALVAASQALGVALGGLPWGWLNDRAGRRLPVQLSYTFAMLLGIAGAFAPSFLWFLVTRFGLGLALAGAPLFMIFVLEFTKINLRSLLAMTSQIPWAIGFLLFSGLAYFTMNQYGWRVFLLLIFIPFLVFVVLVFTMLPESIAYLLVSGKKSEAEKELNDVNTLNAAWPKLWFRPVDAKLKEVKPTSAQAAPSAESSESTPIIGPELETLQLDVDISSEVVEDRGRFSDLFGPLYWWTTVLVNILIFCTHITYMGTMLLTTELVHARRFKSEECASSQNLNETYCRRHCSLQNQDYLDIVIFSLGEFVAAPLGLFLCEYVGRRYGIVATNLAYSACILSIIFTSERLMLVVILFATRVFIATSTSILFLYVGEVYPTMVRGLGAGLSITVHGVAQMSTPFVGQWLSSVWMIAALVVYGVAGAVGALAAALLPIETRARPLEDTVQSQPADSPEKKN